MNTFSLFMYMLPRSTSHRRIWRPKDEERKVRIECSTTCQCLIITLLWLQGILVRDNDKAVNGAGCVLRRSISSKIDGPFGSPGLQHYSRWTVQGLPSVAMCVALWLTVESAEHSQPRRTMQLGLRSTDTDSE